MSALRAVAVAATITGSALSGPAAAAGLPRFDIERACSADAAGGDRTSCLEAERSAKAYLDETWSTYGAAEATPMCLRSMKSHHPAGYRKLLACLMTRGEPMATGGVPAPRDQTQAPPK